MTIIDPKKLIKETKRLNELMDQAILETKLEEQAQASRRQVDRKIVEPGDQRREKLQ